MSLESANIYIESFYQKMSSEAIGLQSKNLKVGIDLGTANICFAVLDEKNNPITGEIYAASVIKDGLVVDYSGAVAIVKELKQKIESKIGVKITHAAAAIPPGTVGKNANAVTNVIQTAGIEVINVIDEPTAAADVLKISSGAVVDIGGGTTGISIIKNKKVIGVYDEATGGSHMSLVVAGHYNISIEDAEIIKKSEKHESEIFQIVKPVIEKMAFIVKNYIKDYKVDKIYVVGGASSLSGFENVFEAEIGIKTFKPVHAILVTPLGIALNCK